MKAPAVCDPNEVQSIAAELARNPYNFGIGVVDMPSGVIRLYPFDETDRFVAANPQLRVMAGHEAAALMAGFAKSQARGFVLAADPATGRWQVANVSHLNLPDGGGLRMDPTTFAEVLAALAAAGVTNPAVS